MDKVFVISQIAVISQQMSNLKRLVEDMDMRLGELYDELYFDDKDSTSQSSVTDCEEGIWYTLYDSLSKKKCDCEYCSPPSDYRMD